MRSVKVMLLGIGLILVGIFSAFGASAMYTVNLSSIICPLRQWRPA